MLDAAPTCTAYDDLKSKDRSHMINLRKVTRYSNKLCCGGRKSLNVEVQTHEETGEHVSRTDD